MLFRRVSASENVTDTFPALYELIPAFSLERASQAAQTAFLKVVSSASVSVVRSIVQQRALTRAKAAGRADLKLSVSSPPPQVVKKSYVGFKLSTA